MGSHRGFLRKVPHNENSDFRNSCSHQKQNEPEGKGKGNWHLMNASGVPGPLQTLSDN